jgi:hypothetical protein
VESCLRLSADLRTVSYLLHPPLLDEMGLRSALGWFMEGFAKRSKIAAKLEVPTFESEPGGWLSLEFLTAFHPHLPLFWSSTGRVVAGSQFSEMKKGPRAEWAPFFVTLTRTPCLTVPTFGEPNHPGKLCSLRCKSGAK